MASSTQNEAKETTMFSDFDIVDVDYKEVRGVALPASILIPKKVKPGKAPLLIRWHGGAMITGHRLFTEWIPGFILNLALERNAIVIMPDYRLIPEATGLDILQDATDFYSWLLKPGNLDSRLPPGVTGDLGHLLVTGESAGGWLALQAALTAPVKKNIVAVIAHYPMIDLTAPHYTAAYEKQLFDPPVAQLPANILHDHARSLQGNEVVPSATPPSRIPFFISALQQGSFPQYLGTDRSLLPLEVLKGVTEIAPTWLLHGEADNLVPIEGSYKWAHELKNKLPHAGFHFSVRPGMHAFDCHPQASLDEDWVKEGVDFIVQYWPTLWMKVRPLESLDASLIDLHLA